MNAPLVDRTECHWSTTDTVFALALEAGLGGPDFIFPDADRDNLPLLSPPTSLLFLLSGLEGGEIAGGVVSSASCKLVHKLIEISRLVHFWNFEIWLRNAISVISTSRFQVLFSDP